MLANTDITSYLPSLFTLSSTDVVLLSESSLAWLIVSLNQLCTSRGIGEDGDTSSAGKPRLEGPPRRVFGQWASF